MNDKLKYIRTIDFCGLKIGSESDFNYNSKPVFALNIPIFNFDDNFKIVKDFFNNQTIEEIIEKSNFSNCDILSLTFNIDDFLQVKKACEILKEYLPLITKPLMIRGSGNDEIDKILLPELIKNLDRVCIVATINEKNYKEIVPLTVKNGHIISIRTPIDINLAKEMNILVSDMGQSLNKILIDSDIGGLGYGLDFGYSIMEKIKLEGFNGDEYLNMPLISFAGEESLKTKEAKADTYSNSFGKLDKRALMFEIAATTAVIAAGANIVVVNHPDTINVLKGIK